MVAASLPAKRLSGKTPAEAAVVAAPPFAWLTTESGLQNVQKIRKTIFQPMRPIFEKWEQDQGTPLSAGGLQALDVAGFQEAMKRSGTFTCVVPLHYIGLANG